MLDKIGLWTNPYGPPGRHLALQVEINQHYGVLQSHWENTREKEALTNLDLLSSQSNAVFYMDLIYVPSTFLEVGDKILTLVLV